MTAVYCYAYRFPTNIKTNPRFKSGGSFLSYSFRFFSVLKAAYYNGAGGVAGYVDNGSAHIENTVDSRNKSDSLNGKSDALEHHCKHHHSGTGNSGSSDGSKSCGKTRDL